MITEEVNVQEDSDDDGDEESPEEPAENSFTLEPGTTATGETVTADITATEELSGEGFFNGYHLKVKTEEGETLHETEIFETTSTTATFTIDTHGEHTVNMLPNTPGQDTPVLGNLIGESLHTETLTVTQPNTEKWRTYCRNREEDYNMEDVTGQVECIQNEIIPTFFQEPLQDDGETEVPESLCTDLLNYNYNSETLRCKPSSAGR